MKPPWRPYEPTPAERVMDFRAWCADELTILRKPNDEWICTCPECSHEKFAVNVRLRKFQCWRCGFSGSSPARLVRIVLGCTRQQAEAIVASYAAGVRLGRVRPLVDDEGTVDQREIPAAPVPPGTRWRCNGDAADYAVRRGIPSDHAYLFGLSGIDGDGSGSKIDRLTRGRLLIPVWSERGRLVHWVARATDGDDTIKTVNLPASCEHPEEHPEDCTCKHVAWGLSPVAGVAGSGEALVGAHLLRRGEPAILVEGPIDAAVCGPGFVATMGAKLSFAQASILARVGPSVVVILFDPDDAGAKGTEKAHQLLSAILPTKIAHCGGDADPAELGRSRALACAERATSGGLGPLVARSAGSKLTKIHGQTPVISKLA